MLAEKKPEHSSYYIIDKKQKPQHVKARAVWRKIQIDELEDVSELAFHRIRQGNDWTTLGYGEMLILNEDNHDQSTEMNKDNKVTKGDIKNLIIAKIRLGEVLFN